MTIEGPTVDEQLSARWISMLCVCILCLYSTGGSTGGGGFELPLGSRPKFFFSSTSKNVNRISVVESVLFHTGTTVNSTLTASVHALS